MLRIATNTMGLNAHRSLKIVSSSSEKSSEKLSSGLKINRAADDAAGLAISEKMRNQINGLNKAQRNVEDGVSLIQTAEGGMSEIGEMIARQRELTIQAMNDTNVLADKEKIQQEINELSQEITATAEKTQFNTIPLLGVGNVDIFYFTLQKGDFINGVDMIQVSAGDSFTVKLEDMTIRGGQNSTIAELMRQTGQGSTTGVLSTFCPPVVPSLGPTYISEEWEFYGSSFSVGYPGSIPNYSDGGDGSTKVTRVRDDGYWLVMLYNHDFGDPSQPAETTYKVTVTYESDDDGPLYIKSGANADQGMYVDRYNCRAEALGIDNLDVSTRSEGELSLSLLDKALETINSYRAIAGAQQNRLEHTAKNLGTSSENLETAKSRITDTDMAKEMMEYTKGNILQQAGMSMLANANQAPQRVLEIIR